MYLLKIGFCLLIRTAPKFGFVISTFSIVFGLYRVWFFLEWNLPDRLEGYLRKYSKVILQDRETLVAATASIAARPLGQKNRNWAQQLADWSTSRKLNKFIVAIDEGSSNPRGDFAILIRQHSLAAKAHAVRSRELATAHFIRATLYAIRADAVGMEESARSEAIKSFREAASLDRGDPRIHRGYVEQLHKSSSLENIPAAIENWIAASTKAEQFREVLRANTSERYISKEAANLA